VLCRVTKLGEDVFSVMTFAEDPVDMFEVLEVALGKSLLVRDEEVTVSSSKPVGENSLEENIGVE